MTAPRNNVCICGLWLRTVILWGDFVMIRHACTAVVWAFLVYDGLLALVPNTAVVCPTSRGVASEMSSRDLHVFGGPCWRILMRGLAFQLPNCRVWCCAFCWLLQDFLMREFILFCYTMIWWYFMLLGPLRDFPMRCHAFRPWWDVMRFPHDIWCVVWPPMRLLCFYLMRFCAVFAA